MALNLYEQLFTGAFKTLLDVELKFTSAREILNHVHTLAVRAPGTINSLLSSFTRLLEHLMRGNYFNANVSRA